MKHTNRLIVGFALFALIGCSTTEPETVLILSISQHPSGGVDVVSVATQFEGKLFFKAGTGIFQPAGEPRDINVYVDWWWEYSVGSNDYILESDPFTFSSESYTTKSTIYSASGGWTLGKYYWVEIHWTDDDGQHSVQSSKAFCF